LIDSYSPRPSLVTFSSPSDFDDDPVLDFYSDDLSGGLLFDSYPDDLGGRPIFNEDPFDPIGDAAHDSDKPDDLTVVLVFDTNPDGLEDGPMFGTYVFDCVDVKLATGVHFDDQGLNQYKLRSVVYNRVVTDVFEHKSWDPGSSEGSEFSRFGVYVDSAHHNELHIDGFKVIKCWDPGLPEGATFIKISMSCAAFHSANLLCFLGVWLTQQKCGGYFDSILACPMLDGAQLQSLALIHSLVGVHITDICMLGAKWIVQFVDSTLSSVSDCLRRDIDSLVLIYAQCHSSIASFSEFSLTCIVFKLSPTALMWCKEVILQGILSVLHWVLVIPGQCCVIMLRGCYPDC
jgi:hypothetical protein